jgi:hypothetical protein
MSKSERTQRRYRREFVNQSHLDAFLSPVPKHPSPASTHSLSPPPASPTPASRTASEAGFISDADSVEADQDQIDLTGDASEMDSVADPLDHTAIIDGSGEVLGSRDAQMSMDQEERELEAWEEVLRIRARA